MSDIKKMSFDASTTENINYDVLVDVFIRIYLYSDRLDIESKLGIQTYMIDIIRRLDSKVGKEYLNRAKRAVENTKYEEVLDSWINLLNESVDNFLERLLFGYIKNAYPDCNINSIKELSDKIYIIIILMEYNSDSLRESIMNDLSKVFMGNYHIIAKEASFSFGQYINFIYLLEVILHLRETIINKQILEGEGLFILRCYRNAGRITPAQHLFLSEVMKSVY